ncbi:MAG: lysine transporter LysE, partial [Polaromonas sp.]
MDIQTWTAFFLASILIAISPGSGAILAMSHGLSYGVRRTQATIAGLQAGLLVILLVAGAGVGSLLVASELAFGVVK